MEGTADPDPLRMFLVVRRGAFEELAPAGELAGAAAVRCVRDFEHDERFADAFAQWRPRPGKVVLRARGGQWDGALAEPHALAGSQAGDGAAVIALPPRRRSERGPLLERMQAMTSALSPPPAEPPEAEADSGRLTYLLNPEIEMSSGKTLAQIAHAAVMAAEGGVLEEWVRRGCPARVLMPPAAEFARLCRSDALAARVEDAGLTEVPPGTVTVLALPPAGAQSQSL
jgi:peptidyl-tRNA hydrolase